MVLAIATYRATAQSAAALHEAQLLNLNDRQQCAEIDCPEGLAVAPGSELLLVTGSEPLTLARLIEAADDHATFGWPGELNAATPPNRVRVWLVRPDLPAALLDRWPAGAELFAEVDSVGPGGQSAWVRAGSNQGAAVGDCWWLRIGRQPAARFDVRFVASEVTFCTVQPLARDLAIRPGNRVALWPAPADRRSGRATSAVSYIEPRSGGMLVWVPAPPNVVCPREPHIDFFHLGRYVGHGLVEARDDRFWYTRFTPPAPGSAEVAAASLPTTAATQASLGDHTRLRVGDEAVIRTQTDIDRRRFVARVFELTPAGALINAGETDGLAFGQRLPVHRSGRPAGIVEILRVQRSYAMVAPVSQSGVEPPALQVGDELPVSTPAPAATLIATLERLTGPGLFTARLAASEAPLLTPLAVRTSEGTVGVAILVTMETRSAAGFVLPCSMTVPPAAGMHLVLEGD
jgi:hypothetical protein